MSSSLASTQPGPGHELDIRERFTSCSTEKQIHLCQVIKDRPFNSFHSHKNKLSAIKWDSQGKFLVSCSDEMTLKLWTIDRENFVQDLKAHKKEIHINKWSPTGPSTKILTSYPGAHICKL